MVNQHVVFSALLGIWALSCIPTVTATVTVCTTDVAGVTTCRSKLSQSDKINIAIACLVVLSLLLILIICVITSRCRARAASEQEYNVEASQVDGPPTIIATEYDPTSGPSGVYEGPKSSFSAGQTSAQITGPTYPVSAQVYNNPTRTAPVTQSTLSYPFPSYSPVPHMAPTPQTSFVSGGFPRAMLAGDRLKDRLKERPASQRTFG